MRKKKVGIMTWHYYSNFGSALQAYALQYSVSALGYRCRFINFRDGRFGKYNCIKYRLMHLLDKMNILENYRFPYVSFQREFLKQTVAVQEQYRLGKLADQFDAVICGSDQVWAPNVFNPAYMLDFVSDHIIKVSYAASIGLNVIPNELQDTYRRLLLRFHAVSVRERKGAELLEQSCHIQSEVVLDPTLLVSKEIWEKIERKALNKDKYIFCYFLNENHKYRQAVQTYARKKGVEVIGCSVNEKDREWMTVLGKEIGPCEFLWLIHHSETVFTDSYHGTIFSLIYHKEFVTFERFENTDKICQNSRIYQLSDCFDLSQRILRIEENSEIVINSMDYDVFEKRLHELKKESIDFLKKALED